MDREIVKLNHLQKQMMEQLLDMKEQIDKVSDTLNNKQLETEHEYIIHTIQTLELLMGHLVIFDIMVNGLDSLFKKAKESKNEKMG